MKRKLFAVWMAAALLLAGCGGGGANGGTMNQMSAADAAPEMPGVADEKYNWNMSTGGAEMDFAPTEAPESTENGGSVYQNAGAKLIRRAELDIQTEQFDQSEKALKQLVASCEGYFEMSSVYGGGRRDAYASRRGEYIVRVPAENYNQFFRSTGDLGYVVRSTESSKDVGEEYYDTEAHLKTQRTKQERLLALLEKAETMEDIIALESALSEVEYQIEQYSSTLNRYDALIGFSTFTISLNEVGRVTQEVGETASLGTRMAAGVQSSFRELGRGFQDLLVWISYHLFLSVILVGAAAAAIVVGRRELKKLRRKDGGTTKE